MRWHSMLKTQMLARSSFGTFLGISAWALRFPIQFYVGFSDGNNYIIDIVDYRRKGDGFTVLWPGTYPVTNDPNRLYAAEYGDLPDWPSHNPPVVGPSQIWGVWDGSPAAPFPPWSLDVFFYTLTYTDISGHINQWSGSRAIHGGPAPVAVATWIPRTVGGLPNVVTLTSFRVTKTVPV